MNFDDGRQKINIGTIRELKEQLSKYPDELEINLDGSDYGPYIMMWFNIDQNPCLGKLMDDEGKWADPEQVTSHLSKNLEKQNE